ncbi:MAG: exo-alpha-sialidase [Saprospiraceae bacterium]|nr:exo-alpha-sialidase [Candidatus Vicinibacter affinis]
MFNIRIIACLFFLVDFVNAQEIIWAPEIKINPARTGSNIRPRTVFLDRDHAVVLWGQLVTKRIQYALWENGKVSNIFTPNLNGLQPFINDWASTEVAGRDNFVYIVFKTDPAESGKIYLMRSEDYGQNFTKPIPIVNPDTFYCRFPGVAVDNNHQPIVSYMRFNKDWSEPHYVSIRSENFGNDFDSFRELVEPQFGEACDCCPVAMESDGDRLAVFYRNNRGNVRNMAVAISNDRGKNFNLHTELDNKDWVIFSCPSTGGDGFFNDDLLHTCWMSGRVNPPKIFYSSYNLSTGKLEQVLSMDHQKGRGQSQNYPRMAGRKDTVAMVWQETDISNDIFFTYSIGLPTGFIKNTIKMNSEQNGNQTHPDVAFHSNKLLVSWSDNADGTVRLMEGAFKVSSQTNHPNKNLSLFTVEQIGKKLSITTNEPVEFIQVLATDGRRLYYGKETDIDLNIDFSEILILELKLKNLPLQHKTISWRG